MGLLELLIIILVLVALFGGIAVSPLLFVLLIVVLVILFTRGGVGFCRGGGLLVPAFLSEDPTALMAFGRSTFMGRSLRCCCLSSRGPSSRCGACLGGLRAHPHKSRV